MVKVFFWVEFGAFIVYLFGLKAFMGPIYQLKLVGACLQASGPSHHDQHGFQHTPFAMGSADRSRGNVCGIHGSDKT